MFYSPLRYPGGKGKLTPLIELLIDKYGHRGGIYISNLLLVELELQSSCLKRV